MFIIKFSARFLLVCQRIYRRFPQPKRILKISSLQRCIHFLLLTLPSIKDDTDFYPTGASFPYYPRAALAAARSKISTARSTSDTPKKNVALPVGSTPV